MFLLRRACGPGVPALRPGGLLLGGVPLLPPLAEGQVLPLQGRIQRGEGTAPRRHQEYQGGLVFIDSTEIKPTARL